ncbi:efflux RND transporter periplasmic adaptor subunit [Acidobacteria bacterium AB60]|nr:efflux RND transporter periplasmic adaptor subunit [Acidobacteria bacterium AB60]
MPQAREITNTVNATGTVKLKTGAEVRVGSQLSGIVRRLNVTVGSRVRQGDVIAEIDPSSVEAKIAQARAQLTESQVSLAKSQNDFLRTQKLLDAGVISRQQMDDATSALDAAKANATAAESGLQAARVDLAYVEIRAPISGTIASVSTQQGETVAASFAAPTFVTIIQESALEVVAVVDEADIGGVRPGQIVQFTTETYPDREFSGRVVRIAPAATIVSGVVNYEVAISIARDIALLRPEMTANVNIATAQHHALLIPAKCVHKQDNKTFVLVRSLNGEPAKQNVIVGARAGDEIEITAGLNPGSAVLLGDQGAGAQ